MRESYAFVTQTVLFATRIVSSTLTCMMHIVSEKKTPHSPSDLNPSAILYKTHTHLLLSIDLLIVSESQPMACPQPLLLLLLLVCVCSCRWACGGSSSPSSAAMSVCASSGEWPLLIDSHRRRPASLCT
jgi:hypothetical protein